MEDLSLDDDEFMLCINVESTECLKIEHRTSLGRVGVATKHKKSFARSQLFYAFMGLGLISKNATLSVFNPSND